MDRYGAFFGLLIFSVLIVLVATFAISSFTGYKARITQGWYEGEVLPVETLEFPQGDMVLSVTSICSMRQLYSFLNNHHEKNWIAYDDYKGCKISLSRLSSSGSGGAEHKMDVTLEVVEDAGSETP